MTGDGAVVRLWTLGGFFTEGLCKEHNALVAHSRQQAAEIERLTEALRDLHQRVFDSDMNKVERIEASEARAADLLKALEMVKQHVSHNWDCDKWEDWADGRLNDKPCTCGLTETLAAAKGGTV